MPTAEPEFRPHPGDVTVLLGQISKGQMEARGQLMAMMYPDLKRLAELRMRRERADHTLQPTALVGELFLAINRVQGINWRDRAHFLAVSSQMMKRYLIDYARAHRAESRGGGKERIQIECLELGATPFDVLEIADLLEKLASEQPRMAQVVDMRCFGGLTHVEVAEALGIDERTSKRDWRVAQAWLQAQLSKRVHSDDA